MISGVLRPTAGRVTIQGQRAEGRRPHMVARLGVARTFQQIRLFREMTVTENVAVGAVARGARSAPACRRCSPARGSRAPATALAGTLAYGLQRRVEIARALAGGPRLLLLDEPAAGMNEAESDNLLGHHPGRRSSRASARSSSSTTTCA